MWDETTGSGELETKYCRVSGVVLGDDARVEGYASLFGSTDQGGDAVLKGAFTESLKAGRKVRMLWQHDPQQPIGVWDEVKEDQKGLWVRGRILTDVAKGREAAALVAAGAIDGLSIGYRTKRSERDGKGRRLLAEVELWEVSLVTFPMLVQARVGSKGEAPVDLALRELADVFQAARREMARD
jgi:HK97 family phage prohead protease